MVAGGAKDVKMIVKFPDDFDADEYEHLIASLKSWHDNETGRPFLLVHESVEFLFVREDVDYVNKPEEILVYKVTKK